MAPRSGVGAGRGSVNADAAMYSEMLKEGYEKSGGASRTTDQLLRLILEQMKHGGRI